MKRKILFVLFVFAIVVMAAWNLNYGSGTKGMSDIELANVEALAQNEGGGGIGCWQNSYTETGTFSDGSFYVIDELWCSSGGPEAYCTESMYYRVNGIIYLNYSETKPCI